MMEVQATGVIGKAPFFTSYTSPETKKVYEGWKIPIDNPTPHGERDMLYLVQIPKETGARLGFDNPDTAKSYIGKTVRFSTHSPRVFQGSMRLEFENFEIAK